MKASQHWQVYFSFTEKERIASFWNWFISGLLVLLPVLYFVMNMEFNAEYRRKDATGFNHGAGKSFVLFYAEKGLFPLRSAADTADLKWNPQLADSLVNCCGSSLLMEKDHWARFGDPGRIWMYMPKVWLSGSPADPGIKLTNVLFYIITLLVVWQSFVSNGLWRLGLLLCLFLLSSPFYLYETMNNENIFGLVSLIGVFLMALHLFFLRNDFKWKYLLIPVLSGLLIALVNSIRTEVLATVASCCLIYFFAPGIPFLKRIYCLLLLLGTFTFTSRIIDGYFSRTYQKTTQFVKEHGGVPFEGGRTMRHPAWHPIYCGLGDFDTKYGYHLHDTAVYHYVIPILRKQLNQPLIYPGKTKYSMGEYYDSTHFYYKKPETIPGFDKVCKEKVLLDISNDPLWYAGIIGKRILYFFRNSSPVALRLYQWELIIPFTGWLLLPLLALLFLAKKWREILLLIFTLPSGASTIVMFAEGQNSYMSAYSLLTAAMLFYATWNYWRSKKQWGVS